MSSHSIQWDPNLKDVSEGRVILIPATLFTVLIILSTSFRIFAKLRLKKTLTVDDFLIIIALAFNLTGNVLEIQCVETGCGRHLQFLDTEERSRTRMLILDIILVANIALWAVKLSISFFLLGLVATVHRRARWIIYGLIIVTTLASLTQLIVWCLQARPLEKAWHPDIPGTVASPYVLITAHVVSQAIGAIADLFYAFSPIYFVGNLQMSPGKKALLISLTGSGLAVFAISIAHLAFVDDFLDPDYTWTLQHRVFIFGLIERNLAEVIANLPGLTPFFRSVYKKTSQIFASCTGGSTSCPDEEKRHGLSVVTIGSGGKPSKKGVTGRFQSLGKNAQFSELNSTLDNDQSRLWNDS
ncbi:integral membrane protein, partial [Annulohypoxylon stygium]